MNTNTLPILYSFRRCPYAIRARMAVFNSAIAVNLIEVSLKNKPQAMLNLSSKGTVPVLDDNGKVIDESLDIMMWALRISDPDNWYGLYSEEEKRRAALLISENDNDFKPWLDKYKYADRFPENPQDYYLQQCQPFLGKLENALSDNAYLSGPRITLVDMALFPFIRQFSMVDKHWFAQCPYPNLQVWLSTLLDLPLFTQVMAKTPQLPAG